MTPLNGISTLLREIRKCEEAGAMSAAVAMSYICIDTMAFLALPEGRETQNRDDFIAWVDTYLRGDARQPYQYRGKDVYGARCALLHAFSSEVNYHERNKDVLAFGYHDGG